MRTVATRVVILIALLACTTGTYAAYRYLRSDALRLAYRGRLQELSRDYAELASRYSALVERTATTELVVENGQLSVIVSTVDGDLRRIPTPFDPRKEIHVDYVVHNGRLWIRRVHDSSTPAERALLIDPALAQPSWSESSYGLAIYRPLAEGRWVVSVSPNGALTLERKPPNAAPDQLHSAPPVRPFERLDESARRHVAELSWLDLALAYWNALVS